MPSAQCQELKDLYSPFIKPWAENAGTLNLQSMPIPVQQSFMDGYLKDLESIELLAYQAIISSLGDKLERLQGGEKKNSMSFNECSKKTRRDSVE